MSSLRYALARLLSRRGWSLGRAIDLAYEVRFVARDFQTAACVTVHEATADRCVVGFHP